jgi:hypothetical protein
MAGNLRTFGRMDSGESSNDIVEGGQRRRLHRKRRAFWKRRQFWIALVAIIVAVLVALWLISGAGASKEVD